ncbi:MAG TPA: hypothetical protein VGM37_10475 [Armatimonadota bacterium]|jgi:hypothetical protein
MAEPFSIDVDLSGLAGLKGAANEIERVLTAAAFQAGARVQAEVVTRMPVDLGAARNNISFHVTRELYGVTVEIAGNLQYLPTLEEGRKAGKKAPPYDALIPWVKRHPSPPMSFLTAKGNRSHRKAPTDKSRAFLIARAIGKRGQPGHHMFRDAAIASAPDVTATFEDAMSILARSLNL